MADEKKNTGPEEHIPTDPPAPEPGTAQSTIPGMEGGPAQPESGDVVVDFEKINELMAERKAAAREKVEQAEPPEPKAGAPADGPSGPVPPGELAGEDTRQEWEKTSAELDAEQKKPRRGRPPKEEKAAPEGEKADNAAKPRKGRPPKADKSAPAKAKKPVRDKVSQGGGAADKGTPAKETAPAPVPEQPPDPATIPRPVEQGQMVYLKLSELHAFHTFREHPYKVQDDDKMKELVGTIQEHGVMTPAIVRPEKEGGGYEISEYLRSTRSTWCNKHTYFQGLVPSASALSPRVTLRGF